MPARDGEGPRFWRIVAQELACETDPAKVQALIEELTQAIRLVQHDDGDLHVKPI